MQRISKKIALFGEFGVGKTSLVKRYVHSTFSDVYLSTIGVTVDKKEVELGNVMVKLLIWDVAGERNADSLLVKYLSGVQGVFFVFDLSRTETFRTVSGHLQKLQTIRPEAEYIVVGNKLDLADTSSLEDRLFSHGIECHYFTSAKTGEGVNDIFNALARQMIRKP